MKLTFAAVDYVYLTFPGCEAVHNALKKLPKYELTRSWGREDK